MSILADLDQLSQEVYKEINKVTSAIELFRKKNSEFSILVLRSKEYVY
jgi:hypothetical protein